MANFNKSFSEKLLGFFCKSSLLEEIMGDLYEYEEEIKSKSKLKRSVLYWYHVLTFLKPWALKKVTGTQRLNHIGMFKNYFKTTTRSVIRNPISSFINIFGLSVAIGICIVVYAFVKTDYDIDRFHEHKDEVFLATSKSDRNGSEQEYGFVPAPLGPLLLTEDPHVVKMCRIRKVNFVVKKGDNVFYEGISFVDPAYLEMFSFPLKEGISNPLDDLKSVVLSERMAQKYFGEENPLGQEVLIVFNEGFKKQFIVSGVAEPFPDDHIIEFNFLINFENYAIVDNEFSPNDWSTALNATFIQLDDPSNISLVGAKMDKYRALQNEMDADWKVKAFGFNQLSQLHLNSANIINGISHDLTAPGRVALPIIGALMLFLACFNYMNMAIATSAKRLKEIGVRKVIGANRSKVIFQFLMENIILTCFALVVGLLLAILIFQPWFVNLTQRPLTLELDDRYLYIFSIALVLFTGVISGAYPAFYISSFKAVSIFRGNTKFGKKSLITRVLLSFQLILACVTITGAVVFAQNTSYQANRGWGYEHTNLVYANVSAGNSFSQLKAKMSQDAKVIQIAGADHHIGRARASVAIEFEERKLEVDQINVGVNYIETVGLEVVAGRSFNKTIGSDKQSILINETLAKRLEKPSLLEQKVKIGDADYQVIGVVSDFHASSFGQKIKPTVIKVSSTADFNFLVMNTREGAKQDVLDHLEAEWKAIYPEAPFLGGLQTDVWGGYFDTIGVYERFNRAIALVAIVLASLGFYGLISLNISSRTKEFSIRKTLGARNVNILASVSRQFVWLALVALFFGAPLSYYAIKAQLGLVFAYAMPVSATAVALSALLLIAMLYLVTLTQVAKVSKASPANGLRGD